MPKFYFQVEVDAPEHGGNPDFPAYVHAEQKLFDLFQSALESRIRMNNKFSSDSREEITKRFTERMEEVFQYLEKFEEKVKFLRKET